MSCLPLRKLPGWLATISPNKVRPELREKVIAYQNEADDVLWAAWQDQQPQAEPQQMRLEKQPPLDWVSEYIPSYVPLPSEVQVALDDKAWQLAAQAYKIIHQHLRFSVNYSCAVGHPERQIDQPEALKLIEKTILDDALVPFQPELTYLVTLSDAIADSAAKYAQAVRDGVHAVRARGGLLGPVLRASRPELKPYPYAKD